MSHLSLLGYSQFKPMQTNLLHNRKLLIGCLAASLNTILCCLYVLLVANTFNEYIDSVFSASGSVGIFIIFSIYIWKIEELFQLIGQIQKTVDASKSDYFNATQSTEKCDTFPGMEIEELAAIYTQTDRCIENKLSKISYIFFVKFTPACLCLPNFVVSFYNYFAMDLGKEAFALPIFMWFPFEWDDPIRYVMITILQYCMVERSIIPIACGVSFIIGIFLWLKSIEKDIEYGLNAIDANTKTKGTQSRIAKQLVDFVTLHTDAKQLSWFTVLFKFPTANFNAFLSS